MKKLSLLIAIAIIFASCAKEQNSVPEQATGKAPVTFSLKGFIQKVSDYNTSARIASQSIARTSNVNYLYLRLYNASNELVLSSSQSYLADSLSFGVFTDSLEYGQYTLLATAASDTLSIRNTALADVSIFGVPGPNSDEILPYPDVFHEKYAFEVSPSGPNNFNVELDRVNGKLEVRMSDATYPFYRITATMTNEAAQYKLNDGTIINTKPENSSFGTFFHMTRENDSTFSNYVLNTAAPFNVIINVRNVVTGIVVTKELHNVQCYPNRRTIISGSILSFDPNLPFDAPTVTVTVKDEWEAGGPVHTY